MTIKDILYKLIRLYRMSYILKLLNKDCDTLLDIGCSDLSFYRKLKNRYKVTLADVNPSNEMIQKQNVEAMIFADKSFDIVLCFQVLEHTYDPVKAIKELERVCKRQLVISVPNEPFFSAFRFFAWDREHNYAITSRALKHFLGEPIFEKKIFFKRYYIGVWNFGDKK